MNIEDPPTSEGQCRQLETIMAVRCQLLATHVQDGDLPTRQLYSGEAWAQGPTEGEGLPIFVVVIAAVPLVSHHHNLHLRSRSSLCPRMDPRSSQQPSLFVSMLESAHSAPALKPLYQICFTPSMSRPV